MRRVGTRIDALEQAMGVGKARVAPTVLVVHPLFEGEDEPTRAADYDRAMDYAGPFLDQLDRNTIVEVHDGGHIRLIVPAAHEFSCWCGDAHAEWLSI